MKNIFIAGNWKSNKTVSEAQDWLSKFTMPEGQATVVILSPFIVLESMRKEIQMKNLPISLGAQNISKFDAGAYTGEVTASMVKEVADWVIIGHSERRKYFGETDADLAQKTEKAKTAGLKVIFCVPDDKTPIPPSVDVVAYEPVWAIGTGKTDTPDNANAVISTIRKNSGAAVMLYGGSVTDGNVASFVAMPEIDGVLPGGASLDPVKFSNLIRAAIGI